MEIRSRYSPRVEVLSNTTGVSMAKQSAAAECDINNIMRKYKATGLISHINARQALFGEFEGPEDYQDAMNAVLAAQEAFGLLPAAVRDRFQNDPAALIAFVADANNRE